jgi:hypothetical protein
MSAPDPRVDDTFPVREQQGILTRTRRRLAWIGFVLLAVNAPLVALAVPDDSWLLSVTVAALVAFVIIVDDVLRRQAPRHVPPDASE